MNVFDLHSKQLELESLQNQWTAERYHRRNHTPSGALKAETSMAPGQSLLRRVVPQFGESI